jgi:mercuric ion binding protein
MTCATCPISVRKAMLRVDGVKSVDVDFDAKTAVVVYDPAVTAPAEIAAASTAVGYPAAQKT